MMDLGFWKSGDAEDRAVLLAAFARSMGIPLSVRVSRAPDGRYDIRTILNGTLIGPRPKPTIPQVASRFAAYRRRPGNEAWGALHIVLDDDNVRDDDVASCVGYAISRGDLEALELALVLLLMSKTQRRKLPRVVHKLLRATPGLKTT